MYCTNFISEFKIFVKRHMVQTRFPLYYVTVVHTREIPLCLAKYTFFTWNFMTSVRITLVFKALYWKQAYVFTFCNHFALASELVRRYYFVIEFSFMFRISNISHLTYWTSGMFCVFTYSFGVIIHRIAIWTEVGTSAPPSAPPNRAPVRNRNFGVELMVRNKLKKVRNGRCETTKNYFRTFAPTDDSFHLNSNIVSF